MTAIQKLLDDGKAEVREAAIDCLANLMIKTFDDASLTEKASCSSLSNYSTWDQPCQRLPTLCDS